MLNEKLKSVRKSHQMTQETLAARLGVTRQTVSKWENGLSVPDADILSTIANIFDVPINKLLDMGESLDESNIQKAEPDAIAKALSIINEQLTIKNRQRKTTIKIIKIVLIIAAIMLSCLLIYILFWMYIAATM